MSRLIDCKKGSRVRIAGIGAGHGAMMNLMNFGLSVGEVVEVSKKSNFRGPVVVVCRETDIAIGYGIAEKILVEGI